MTINGTNDGPVALDDTNSVTEDSQLTATGAVIAGTVATGSGGTGGADTDVDGDDLDVVGFVTGDADDGDLETPDTDGTIIGSYGTLTWSAETGAYTYTLDNTNAAVQALGVGETLTDTFTYEVTDGNGGIDTANLTMTINGTNDTPTINITGGTHTVYESGLPDGSNIAPTTTVVEGTFTLADTDGLDDLHSIKVNGETFTMAMLIAATPGTPLSAGDTPAGELFITDYDETTGVVSYQYVLQAAQDDLGGVEQDQFTVSVSDDGVTYYDPETITVTIVDDLPLFINVNDGNDDGVVSISAGNVADTYFNQFTDWTYGADGPATLPSYTLSPTTGNVSLNVASDADTIIIDLKDAEGNLVGQLTLNADGTDSLQVLHRDSEIVFTPVAATSATAGGPAGSLLVDLGLAAEFNILVSGSDGDSDPTEFGGGGASDDDLVNTSNNGWAVKGAQGQTVEQGESIKFSFVNDDNNTAGFGIGDFKFTTEGYTGGITTATITVRVYLDASLTSYDVVTIDVTSGQVIQISQLDWSAVVGTGSYTAGADIYGVEIISAEPDGSFRLNGVEVGQSSDIPPPDLSFDFSLSNLTDGDGDTTSLSFNVTLDGDTSDGLVVEAIVGTTGDDILTGTDGNDVLIGGLGNDSMTGGLGADVFKWLAGDASTGSPPDTITDFNKAQGDVLNFAELLQGEDGTAANLATFLNFTLDSGNTVIKVDADGGNDFGTPDQTIVLTGVDLVTGGGTQTDIIQSLLTGSNLVTD